MKRISSFILIYILLLIVVISPVWWFDFLPLQDYPNHLARMHILANINQNDFLQSYYTVKFSIVPNLAIDLTVPYLVKLFGIKTAGKLMISFLFVLITGGSIFLNFCLFKKINILPFLSFILLYNSAFSLGFINFLVSIGFSLWAIGFWILFRSKNIFIQLIFFSIISSILFIGHLYAIGIYGIVVTCYEFSLWYQNRPYDFQKFKPIIMVGLGQFIIPLILFLLAPTSSDSVEESTLKYVPLMTKFSLQYLGSIGDYYNVFVTQLTAILIWIIPVISIFLRKIDLKNTFIFGLGLLMLCYICMPNQLLTASHADWRFLIPLALVFISSLKFTSQARRTTKLIFTGIFLILLSIRMTIIYQEWSSWQPEYREMITAIDQIEEGSLLFSARAYEKDGVYSYRNMLKLVHVPTTAIIHKSAFVPTLFSFSTQQPVQYTEEYKQLSKDGEEPFYQYGRGIDWQEVINNYNYVLISHENLFEDPIPKDLLTKIWQGDSNVLYQVKP